MITCVLLQESNNFKLDNSLIFYRTQTFALYKEDNKQHGIIQRWYLISLENKDRKYDSG